MPTTRPPVITLDGPSGTGKGTLCHLLAARLGWHCLDSGAMYRVFALSIMQAPLDIEDTGNLIARLSSLPVRFEDTGVYLNEVRVDDLIRTEQCGQLASKLAQNPLIRAALLARQRDCLKPPGLVTDGRDMGTVVFPDADLKIYLLASLEIRAMRRHLQLKKIGKSDTLAQVAKELAERDARDISRVHAPLKPANDAIVIDTTGLSIDDVFLCVMDEVNRRGLC